MSGDLLQAGPLLVENGKAVDISYEGFSEGSDQFDADLTAKRYARGAVGIRGNTLITFACDNHCEKDNGLTVEEVADVMIEQGVESAMNLDGGGSTSLISGAKLCNVPRHTLPEDISRGRPISSALVISQK